MQELELLAPAGDLEKLKYAIHYGADAVYMGGEVFGLRTNAKNFTIPNMKEGIEFAHERGKKVYLTLNIIPHDEDLDQFYEYIDEIKDLGFDAFIVADPGTFMALKEMMPDAEIHISTQANTTNAKTASFWYAQGAKRIVLARELSLPEIAKFRANTPDDLDIEAFVHGAMCMSYSGRCLISSFLNARSANKGACSQPCRWKYSLVEETRPGEHFPIEEVDGGTYFFNSRDLCTIDFLDQVINSGVRSLKIEGRAKTIYYVSTVVRAYRDAIDTYLKDPDNYQVKPEWLEELTKASYRDYTKGFYFGNPNEEAQNYDTSSYIRNYDFVGVVLEYDNERSLAKIEQRGKFSIGDEIEIIGPDFSECKYVVNEMYNKDMEPIEACQHAKMVFYIKIPYELKPMDILRKKSLSNIENIQNEGCTC